MNFGYPYPRPSLMGAKRRPCADSTRAQPPERCPCTLGRGYVIRVTIPGGALQLQILSPVIKPHGTGTTGGVAGMTSPNHLAEETIAFRSSESDV
jgi:hypothetical protein